MLVSPAVEQGQLRAPQNLGLAHGRIHELLIELYHHAVGGGVRDRAEAAERTACTRANGDAREAHWCARNAGGGLSRQEDQGLEGSSRRRLGDTISAMWS